MFKSGAKRDSGGCVRHVGVLMARSRDGIEPVGGGQRKAKAENKTKSE